LGAIAQLGERLLCKQEVVGSIPSGSTSLRSFRASARQAGENEGCRGVARKSEAGRERQPPNIVREANTVSHASLLDEVACVISDIVKRRSIRVLDRKRHSFGNARRVFSDAISRSFVARHRKMISDSAILLVTLDRIAIGPILRSNLVFLLNVSCAVQFSSEDARRRTRSAENGWTLRMRAIKCLKGVRRMPWR
jgi:hypothetical protein